MAKRLYLFEVIKKHGESKNFFFAIILSFIGVLLCIPHSLYQIVSNWNDNIPFSVTRIIALIFTVIISFFVYHSLINVYRYFRDETERLFGLKLYFKLQVIALFIIPLAIIGNFLKVSTDETNFYLWVAVFLSVVLFIISALFLIPVKKAIDCGIGAANDELAGKITVPMKVLCILYCIPNFTTLQYYDFDNGFETIILILSIIAILIQCASQILFAKTAFEFDKDINAVASEWKRKNSNRKQKTVSRQQKG